MTNTESILTQRRRAHDETKRRFDEQSSRRELALARRQQLINDVYVAQAVFESAAGRGDIDAMRLAKVRLAEIRDNRNESTDVIAAMTNACGQAQMQYGEACDQLRFAESDAEFLARRIPDLRRRLVMAQRREGQFSVYNDNSSPDSLNLELQKCESRYFVLTGKQFSEQFPATAA